MAALALTRGVSFRRQGSSGLSWTDSWSFNEEGELVRSTKEDAAADAATAMATMMIVGNESNGGGTCSSSSHVRFGGSSLARIHDLQDDEDGDGDEDGDESKKITDQDSNKASETSPSSSFFARSKSVGSSLAASVYSMPSHTHNKPPLPPPPPPRNGSVHLLKWFKKRFSKTRN